MIILYLIFGLIGGIVGGMGMGGGTLLIPLLTLFCNIEQIQAQGINLICFLPMAICSIIFHLKNKLIKFKDIHWIIISGIITTILGSILAIHIDSKKLKIFFAIFLIALGIYQFLTIWITSDKTKHKGK